MKKIAAFAMLALLLTLTTFHMVQAGERRSFRMSTLGPGGPGFEEHLSAALDLTDDQKAEAKKLHQELMDKVKPIMAQHQAQMEEIHTLLDGDNPDATEIGTKTIAAHGYMKQIRTLHEEGMERFSTLLTTEQKAKFDELKESHVADHGPMIRFMHRMPGH